MHRHAFFLGAEGICQENVGLDTCNHPLKHDN